MKKLIEMLQENTGRHFLDSGGTYGRNWQNNQGVDFENQPEGSVEFHCYEGKLDIVPVLNVYHFLKKRLTYNEELDQCYREYGYLDIHSAESFAKSIGGKGLYGGGEPFTVNTYNDADLLSQIIQYVYWADDNGAHVLLQIHGGCDARSGYTDPVAFDLNDSTAIFDNACATIYCEDCGKYWDSDDGYHWRSENGDNLQEYPAIEDPEYYGIIWVKNGKGHCPFCGGVLNIGGLL